MKELSEVVESYMARAEGLDEFCERCLSTGRYEGNVVLMIVDADVDSIGLNYFKSVVPTILKFEDNFVKNGDVRDLEDLTDLPHEKVEDLWVNERSWNISTSVASYLHGLGMDRNLNDREALRTWASETAALEG